MTPLATRLAGGGAPPLHTLAPLYEQAARAAARRAMALAAAGHRSAAAVAAREAEQLIEFTRTAHLLKAA